VEGERDAATLTVLRTPLGSLRTPGFAGPNGIPLMAEFPAPADPAIGVPTMLWADAGIGPFERRRQYLGIVAAGFRIVLQFTIGHDRSRVQATSQKLGTALNPPKHPAPSDQEVIAAIQSTAAYLSKVAGDEKGAGADAAREVDGLLERLASADAGVRGKAEAAIASPLVYDLDQLRNSLAPTP